MTSAGNRLPAAGRDHSLSDYYNQTGQAQKKFPFPGNDIGKIWMCPTVRATPADNFLQAGKFGFFDYVMNLDLKLKSDIRNGVVGNSFPYPTMPKTSTVHYPSLVVLLTEVTFSPNLENYVASPDRNGISRPPGGLISPNAITTAARWYFWTVTRRFTSGSTCTIGIRLRSRVRRN